MTYDPFASGSNDATAEAPQTTPPAVTNVATAPNPFKIGFTLKAASGFEAEWLTPTVYGADATQTAERGRDLLVAMQEVGLIELTAKAAEYTRSKHLGKSAPAAQAGKPTFNNGRVQRPGNQSGGQATAKQGPPCECGDASAYTEWGENKYNPGQPNKAFKCATKVADYRDPAACDFIKWIR
ncbi:hypothetical protein ABZV77_11405 [Streptomyces sp. NPDC004732]|uniref:hypothetical protein n=1 Tax=Streptomyces sp. NPDC004732 TaxID=3154290 RepID=UPI0033BA064E